MKHILIILSLGILGASLYWTATKFQPAHNPRNNPATADSSQPADTGVSAETAPATTEEDPKAGTLPNNHSDSLRQTATTESTPGQTATDRPSQLKRYEGVYRELERNEPAQTRAPAQTVPSTPSETGPNRALQSYQSTLRTINE